MKKILFIIALSCSVAASAQTYTLEQLKDSALHHNIAVRSAMHSLDIAQQQRKEAFTKYFPSVSGTGLWFNADKSMAKMEIDPSEYISPELGAALAQSLPVQALAALGSPITMTMMKMPVTHVGMPKDESILPEMALTWVMLPMPKEAMRQNKENSVARILPIHLQPFRLPRPSLR